MSMFMQGAIVNEVDDFNNFNSQQEGLPLPRWERKAMESKALRSIDNAPAATPTKPAANSVKKHAKTPQGADRFIPNRGAMDLDHARMKLHFESGKENSGAADAAPDGANSNTNSNPDAEMDTSDDYASGLLDAKAPSFPSQGFGSAFHSAASAPANSKILAFKNKAPAAPESHLNSMRVLYAQPAKSVRRHRVENKRSIPQAPEKILDAPEILDDYYLNLLHWNSNNILAVALGQSVYLWNATSGSISQLYEMSGPEDYISSVSWIEDGNYLAIGTSDSTVQIWDSDRGAKVREMRSHSSRVGALAWNGPILASGSRDSFIHNHDVRIANHHIETMAAHDQEVCGLQWSPNGTQLASGGNDNILNIWDAGQTAAPKFSLDHHTAAVKAVAWCPWQTNLLASGGGTADRHLRFWNTQTGACVDSVDTLSQVCSIQWSKSERELVTSHGFSQNQLTLWKYPSLTRAAELTGHTARVLHTAISPDGQTVVSAAADETLRFWKVFAAQESVKKASEKESKSTRNLMRGINIR